MYNAEEHKILTILKSADIHVTRCRIAVYKMFVRHKEALPTSYINKYLSGILDRTSVYRALKLFIQKGILVRIPNTEGEIRYILTQHIANKSAFTQPQVACFVCTCCQQTELLDESIFQRFKLPKSINANQWYFLIEGVCKKCAE